MKYVCILALISVAVYLTHGQEFAKENEFEEVDVDRMYGRKPGHGRCWRYPYKYCTNPGKQVSIDRKKCRSCRCNGYFGETCCEGDPYPIVRKPRHCDIERNPNTCEYDRHSRCKGACAIVAYEYSELADYDEGWAEE